MPASSTADVRYVKESLQLQMKLYRRIRACVAGPDVIRELGKEFLPHPDPAKADTKEGKDRYKNYLLRAMFYNITGNTVKGMAGQIFARDPVVKVPEQLEIMEGDVNGSGVSLSQQARAVVEDVISLGRHALMVDYPTTNGAVSQADLDSGNIRPMILAFQPEKAINWRESSVGAKKKLTLVVLRDTVDTMDADGEMTFDEDTVEIFRELRLISGIYWVRVWSEDASGTLQAGEWLQPKKNDGTPFREIPVIFPGADNNDPTIDDAPMKDISELNIGHYRNSADYEDSVFMVGQPTPVISGLNREWVDNVLKGEIVYGSRVAIKLPTGGDLKMVQAEPNTMVKEAMDTKERQMVALGARLVEQRSVQRTATEYGGDKATQTSILATISRNVTAAYLQCFQWVCDFAGTDIDDFEFELNTDFELARMTPEEQQQVIASWQAKAITYTEMRFNLKKGGVAFQEDEEAREEAEADTMNQPLPLDAPPDTTEDPVVVE